MTIQRIHAALIAEALALVTDGPIGEPEMLHRSRIAALLWRLDLVPWDPDTEELAWLDQRGLLPALRSRGRPSIHEHRNGNGNRAPRRA